MVIGGPCPPGNYKRRDRVPPAGVVEARLAARGRGAAAAGYRSAYLEEVAEGVGYTTRWQLFLVRVGVAMAVGGVLFFDWGPGALVGLSMTLPMLRAHKLRDKQKPPYIVRRRRRPGD